MPEREGVDELGFDPDFATGVLLPLLRPLHRRYWRVTSRGAERLPTTGALLVANHAGAVPADALMLQLDVFEHTGRLLRALGAEALFEVPVLGELSRMSGAVRARPEHAARLLSSGQLVAAWPEGVRGIGKPYRERYQLQRFGRGEFVAAALRARVPIVPTAIIGSEEIYPLLYNARSLARLLGLPLCPIVAQMFALPLIGPLALLPLPSKWRIEYGEPVDTGGFDPALASDPMVVFDLTEQIRTSIQRMLEANLEARRSVFR